MYTVCCSPVYKAQEGGVHLAMLLIGVQITEQGEQITWGQVIGGKQLSSQLSNFSCMWIICKILAK